MAENFPVRDLIVAMTSGSGNCAEVSWSFIGLSIPAWLSVFNVMAVVSHLADSERSWSKELVFRNHSDKQN